MARKRVNPTEEEIELTIEPLSKFTPPDPNEGFEMDNSPCGTPGIIFTKDRPKRFVHKCGKWTCEKCRDQHFQAWKDAIDLVWPKDRLYVALIPRPSNFSQWLDREGIEEAVRVVAEDDLILVVSGLDFRGSKRTRKKKVFGMMRRYLFDDHTDHGKKRKIEGSRGFRSNLGGIVRNIIDSIHTPNSNIEIAINPYNIKNFLNLRVVNSSKALSGPAWRDVPKWRNIVRKWHTYTPQGQARMLKKLFSTQRIPPTKPGWDFIRNHGGSPRAK